MRIREHLSVAANIAVITLVAFVMLRPSGPVGSKVMAWYSAFAVRRIVAQEWSSIAQTRRIDSTPKAVVMVEFADYECPACRRQYITLERVLHDPRMGGVAFRHVPLVTIHPKAGGAARAAICAEKQGRFPQMHRQLMTTDVWLADSNWSREGAAAGVSDSIAFRLCLGSAMTTAALKADIAIATRLNIRGTPAFVGVDKVNIGGMPDSAYLKFATSLTR